MHEAKMGTWTDTNFKSNLAQVVSYHPVKFQVGRTKHLSVSLESEIFQMSAHPKRANGGTLIISKATKPWWCLITLLIFKLIKASLSYSPKIKMLTDGWRDRQLDTSIFSRVGYMQPAKLR